jgi:hypothetical protein
MSANNSYANAQKEIIARAERIIKEEGFSTGSSGNLVTLTFPDVLLKEDLIVRALDKVKDRISAIMALEGYSVTLRGEVGEKKYPASGGLSASHAIVVEKCTNAQGSVTDDELLAKFSKGDYGFSLRDGKIGIGVNVNLPQDFSSRAFARVAGKISAVVTTLKERGLIYSAEITPPSPKTDSPSDLEAALRLNYVPPTEIPASVLLGVVKTINASIANPAKHLEVGSTNVIQAQPVKVKFQDTSMENPAYSIRFKVTPLGSKEEIPQVKIEAIYDGPTELVIPSNAVVVRGTKGSPLVITEAALIANLSTLFAGFGVPGV